MHRKSLHLPYGTMHRLDPDAEAPWVSTSILARECKLQLKAKIIVPYFM